MLDKQKYLVLVPDGMSDVPVEQLGGKTPLEFANTPNMDRLIRAAEVGTTCHVPDGMTPESSVANMSIMGYDPKVFFTGRGPIEAANMGLDLEGKIAYRCNLVTVQDEIMVDFSSGHITIPEGTELMRSLQESLGNDQVTFHPGRSYRHILMTGPEGAECQNMPPHDIVGQNITEHLPTGKASAMLRDLMERSREVLREHPVNLKRIQEGKSPATQIWPWGQGPKPKLPLFMDLFGLTGAVISAVDLIQGIGRLIGFQVIEVPGATGFVDTNYEGKADAALKAFEQVDLVYLHVEAPDESGHLGDARLKAQAIEDVDKRVLGRILEKLPKPYRILILPDHPTPVHLKTHSTDPVPFMIYDSSWSEARGSERFCERTAQSRGFWIKEGFRLMEQFLRMGTLRNAQ